MKNSKLNFLSSQARFVPPVLVLAILTTFAEVVVRTGLVPEFLVPAPSAVLRCFAQDHSALLIGLKDTLVGSGVGFLISLFVGTFIALVMNQWTFWRRAVFPYAVFFQTVPVLAVAPMLVIWFGFGLPTVIASSVIVSVFPIIANTYLGLRSTDRLMLDLFYLYQAPSWKIIWRLRIPYALPQIFAGWKIAAGLAVIGAVVGQFIGGGGLGDIIDAARTQQRIDLVFAAVILSSLLGLILTGIVDLIAWTFLRNWHSSESESDI